MEKQIVSTYNKLLQQYNDHLQQVDEDYDEEIQSLFTSCNSLYLESQKQRDMNNTAFQTICDNYCVINFYIIQ